MCVAALEVATAGLAPCPAVRALLCARSSAHLSHQGSPPALAGLRSASIELLAVEEAIDEDTTAGVPPHGFVSHAEWAPEAPFVTHAVVPDADRDSSSSSLPSPPPPPAAAATAAAATTTDAPFDGVSSITFDRIPADVQFEAKLVGLAYRASAYGAKHIEHEIRVTLDGHSWECYRRYSEFAKLHGAVNEVLLTRGLGLRPFVVPKLLLHTEAALQQREALLQDFLDECLSKVRQANSWRPNLGIASLESFLGLTVYHEAPHTGYESFPRVTARTRAPAHPCTRAPVHPRTRAT